MLRYCGFDPTERQIVPRSPASRFSDDKISEMIDMARAGASSIEIGKALGIKPESIRARLWRSGVRLHSRMARTRLELRRKANSRLRLVVAVTKRMRVAADQRGIGIAALVRRLLAVISRDNLFDELLPIPRAHSLGAAAVGESKPPVVIIRAPQFAVVL